MIILPCPKCGHPAEHRITDNGYTVISCTNESDDECCGQYGEVYVMINGTLEEAVKIWNKRI